MCLCMSTIVPCLFLSLIDCKVCYETIYLCETFRQLLRHIYNAWLEWADKMWWSMLKFFCAVSLDSAWNHATILNPHGPRKLGSCLLPCWLLACVQKLRAEGRSSWTFRTDIEDFLLLETPAIILALKSALLEAKLLSRKTPFCAPKVVFSALLRFLNPKPSKPWALLELQLVAWILFL